MGNCLLSYCSQQEGLESPAPKTVPSPLDAPFDGASPDHQEETRGTPAAVPPGSPERQKSASPRTPPLASQSFVFAAGAAKRQNPAVKPQTPAASLQNPAPKPQTPAANLQTPALKPQNPAAQLFPAKESVVLNQVGLQPPIYPSKQQVDLPPENSTSEEVVEFSTWEKTQVAAILEHFEKARRQVDARAFVGSGLEAAQGGQGLPREEALATGPGDGSPLKRNASFESAESCFELAAEHVFGGSAADVDDVIDPIVRVLLGMPGVNSPLVNYYDLAEKVPSPERVGVKGHAGAQTGVNGGGRLPVNEPAEGEVPLSRPLGGIYTGVKRPEKAGIAAAYPWMKDPSPALARWLKSDRDEEASFWAPSTKAEPVPNWARGVAGKDGACVGRKTANPFSAVPGLGARAFGDHEAARPNQESPKRPRQERPASVRTRGSIPIDQVKRRQDPNKEYVPARVNELRDARGGDISGPNTAGGRNRGRSVSVIDRASQSRSAAKDDFRSSRSLTPLRFRTVKSDLNRRVSANPRPDPSEIDGSRSFPARNSASPSVLGPISCNTTIPPILNGDVRGGEEDSADKENVGDVSRTVDDVSKQKRGTSAATEGGEGGPPVPMDRALSLRDPNREPALVADYVDVPTKGEESHMAAEHWFLADAPPKIPYLRPPQSMFAAGLGLSRTSRVHVQSWCTCFPDVYSGLFLRWY